MKQQDINYYWKTVVDTIQDGVMIVDTEGTIISINHAFETITGYSREEILGKSCEILNCSSCEIARNKKSCHWCMMFERGRLRKQRCHLMKKNGDFIHVIKNASVLTDDKNNITGAVETITDVTDLIEKETQIETFRRELHAEDRFYGIIGVSAAMQKVFDLIGNAADSDAPVIIYGESGTGKELVAKAIHEAGSRRNHPYIKVNCAALNENLLESELFGHVKGAFTGAHRNREGRFEMAKGGNIFLDEIGDLPMSTQVKLLRVLEEKVVERVGDNQPIKVDARIVSATNKDLYQLIEQGAYREDFYYRINVIPISIPPLRERAEDIPLLAESFFSRIKMRSGKKIKGISNRAMSILMNYSWPGNVRELKSAFEFAFVSCQDTQIAPQHLPPRISHTLAETPAKENTPTNLNEIKKRRLMEALQQTGGNQSATAKLLGMSRTSVWNQMKRFNLKKKQFV